MEQAIKDWLTGYELDDEQTVFALLLLGLAKDYDEKRFTATAAELRRTFNDLRESLKPVEIEFDPLREMLSR